VEGHCIHLSPGTDLCIPVIAIPTAAKILNNFYQCILGRGEGQGRVCRGKGERGVREGKGGMQNAGNRMVTFADTLSKN
jgi:hypothetical protein